MAVNTGSFQTPKPKPVHFTEAIEFLRNKTRMPSRAWTDTWHDQHSRAFVVAGAMKDALIGDFHEAVTKAIADGTTIEDFRKDFDRIVSTHGWSYKGSPGWRSRTILETNMRTAYSAGRWAQTVRNKATRPYIRYVHGHPLHPRPLHLAWHNTILPVDDPWWRTHFAPNGWGCQCITQSLSEADLKRYGWKVSDEAPPTKLVRHMLNTPDGPREVFVPEGIDPGFGYNPGEGAFGRGANLTAIEEHGEFQPLHAPSSMADSALPLDAQATLTRPLARDALYDNGAVNEAALRDAFNKSIGGNEAIFTDPIGGRVSVTQAVVDHLLAKDIANVNRAVYWPFMRELIETPQEIWVGFSKQSGSGLVRLRRRYVSYIQLKSGEVIGLVADEQGGFWQALTFFKGSRQKDINGLRVGVRLYGGK